MRDRRSEENKAGLSFERRFVRPAGAEAFLFFSLGRLRGGVAGILRSRHFKTRKKGLSSERWSLYPAGTEAFIFFNLGRLRGGRQMGAC